MSRFAANYPSYPQPPLRPGDDIAGKTIFVYKEFYFGDTLQFVRYAKLAADKGAKVVLAAQNALHPLLRSLDSRIDIVAENAKPEAFDFHCPLMSLPHAFGTTQETIPSETPYLHAERDRVERWRGRIGAHGFKIGVCWQGSKLSVLDGRSFSLGELTALSRLEGVRLISLQKNDGVEQLARRPADMKIVDFGDELDSDPGAFRDTAAILEGLDLVITPDTALAHLAGALGRPAFVVLKAHPEWRWMSGQSRTPWYPRLRLFRQTRPGDWAGVFDEVENALREIMKSRDVGKEAVAT